ncbi:MAG: hypothetical protein IKX40_02730 [Thermoguttaceae bacterium]|nr:hypothetical protein [Thermoguttaceae bacterium]
MKKFISLSAALLIAAVISGCCQSPYFAYPRLDQPHGTVQYQRQLYSKFDPFPDPNIGPGIPDFRPADYQDPARDKSSLRVPYNYSNGYSRGYSNGYPNSCYPYCYPNNCCQ